MYVDKDLEKLEPSYTTASGNIKWCNCFEKSGNF